MEAEEGPAVLGLEGPAGGREGEGGDAVDTAVRDLDIGQSTGNGH